MTTKKATAKSTAKKGTTKKSITREEIEGRKAEAKAPESAIKEHMLTMPLNEHLKAEIADNLTNLQLKIDAKNEDKKDFDERKKQEGQVIADDLRALNQQYEEVFLALKQGKVTKSVRCKKLKDPDNNVSNFYDKDGKLIHSQPFTVEDGVFHIEDEFENKK